MIKILFPPGCYGTFLSRCLYNYSSLNTDQVNISSLEFDEDGSSHEFRKNKIAHRVISCCHFDQLDSIDTDDIVTILPCKQHRLDYVDNHFAKHGKSKIISHITNVIDQKNIEHKLATRWEYHDQLDENVPRWILREWFSFWLVDFFDGGYNDQLYRQVKSKYQTNTLSLFTNLEKVIQDSLKALDLEFVEHDLIQTTQKDFVANQKYHGIQIRCDKWVESLLGNADPISNPCLTIFDEAYVQYLLRKNGYEIKCNGLEHYPLTLTEMKDLIYHVR
jgi:hypothetical protein